MRSNVRAFGRRMNVRLRPFTSKVYVVMSKKRRLRPGVRIYFICAQIRGSLDAVCRRLVALVFSLNKVEIIELEIRCGAFLCHKHPLYNDAFTCSDEV